MFTGSEDYSNYGFRFNNWIEAKYFRGTTGVPPNTQNLGLILADIIRLTCLVPKEEKNGKLRSGRYFLHVYQGDPFNSKYVISQRADKTERKWIKQLTLPGVQVIDDYEISQEKRWKSFFSHLPTTFENLKLSTTITNYVFKPNNPDNKLYTIILSRIDAASVEFETKKLKINLDRTYEVDGEYDDFRKLVAKAFKETKSQKIKKKK